MNIINFKILNQNNHCQVLGFHSNFFGLNSLFKYRIELLNPNFLDWNLLKNKAAELTWIYCGKKNIVRGIISQIIISEPLNNQWHYTISLRSSLFLLHFNYHNRTWVNKSIAEIFREIFKIYPKIYYHFNFQKNQKIPFICQYQQSDLDFFRQLLFKFQLYYRWEFSSFKTKLIIFDQLTEKNTTSISFKKSTGMVTNHNFIFKYEEKYALNKQNIFQLKTNNANFNLLDNIIGLDTSCFDTEKLKIIRISHHAKLIHHSVKYFNCINCVENQTIKLNNICFKFRETQHHIYLPAKIIGYDTYANVDQNGQYEIEFLFDTNHNHLKVRQLQPYGGKSSHQPDGLHFPLTKNTLVVIGFVNGKLEKPIILGALNTIDSPDVVTSKNATQNRLQTPAGNEMILDDNGTIELFTPQKNQYLSLSKKLSHEGSQIKTQKGNINLETERNFKLLVENHNILNTEQHYIATSKICQIMTEHGDIKICSGKNLRIKTVRFKISSQKSNFNIRTKNKLCIVTKNLEIVSRHTVNIKSTHKCSIQCQSFHLQSNNSINLNQGVLMNKSSIQFQLALLDSPVIFKNEI